ncbi:MAG: hypothetical protein AB7J40_04025 [Candidatus Altimarinota bacterium]
MLRIEKVFEINDGIIVYLQKRGILKQYLSAKRDLLSGHFTSRDLKKRQPKSQEKWSFRINKKYRAFGYFDANDFIVVEINDHQ